MEQREAFLVGAEEEWAIRAEVITLLAGLENEPNAAEPLPSVFTRAAMPAKVGPYTITGILGQGGMGIVYAAEIERAGEVQLVALKLIQTHLDEPEHAARFTREQKILARLDHPGHGLL